MKFAIFFLVLGFASAAQDDHPIQKVVNLLEKLQAQVKTEGEEEGYSYAKYSKYCADVDKDKTAAIAKHNELIAIAKADIESYTKEAANLGLDIAELEKQINEADAALLNAKNVRGETNDAFVEAQTDYKSVLTAISEALKAVRASKPELAAVKSTVRKAMVLAEIYMTSDEHSAVHAFLQETPDVDRVGKTKVYDFKSGGVIEVLKKLKAKFEEEKLESTKGEMNSKNAYDLMKQAKDETLVQMKATKNSKTALKGEKESAKAETEGDLAQEEDDLATDTAFHKDVMKGCDQKKSEWEERSKVREGELRAMAQAVEIMQKMSGVRNPDTYTAPARTLAFVQVGEADPKARVVQLLRKVATEVHAVALSKLAADISQMPTMQSDAVRKSDPFSKIKAMIQKMIFQLQAEQKDENDHKAWCDKELDVNTQSQTQKTADLELLNKKINVMNAEVEQLTNDIHELNEEVVNLDKYMAEETSIREENKAENKAAIKEAGEAEKACQNAMSVLKEFYKSSGAVEKKPWEFMQVYDAPATWDSSYSSTEGGTGVITMLEDIAKDFAQMQADSKAQEESDETAFQEDITASSVTKAEKSKKSEMKAARKNDLMEQLEAKGKSKAHLSEELDTVSQYLKDLRPACVDGDSTFEDRKGARTKEIEALREAQNILTDAFDAKEFAQISEHKFLSRQ